MNSPADAATAGEAGERALIARIRERIPSPASSVVVGIGDDAAVLTPERGALQVLTTDALVEGVHFDFRFSTPADVGHKALAVNVSDIAAMGGQPSVALLSLMIPPALPLSTIDGLIDGLLALAAAERVALVGGNITQTPGPLVVDVTVSGQVRLRKLLRRSGARPGDLLYVSGTLGAAAAGLDWLSSGGWEGDEELAACAARHRRPEPRTRVGMLLGRLKAASACMDLSDGLADGVSQICAASGVGAVVDAEALPLAPGVRRWFEGRGRDAVDAALTGGDDYELVFAVRPKLRGRLRAVGRESRGVSLTQVGELTKEPGVRLRRGGHDVPLPSGYQHFT